MHNAKMKTTPRANPSHSALFVGRLPAIRPAGRFSFLLLACFLGFGLVAAETKRIALVRPPAGGIQPQAAVDSLGVVHLIYYKGDAGGGDIFYVRRAPGQDGFSMPLPVNSQAGSAIAAGTIRGAQLA